MRDALRYEIVRLRTIRSTWWLSGLALGLGLLIATLLTWAFHHDNTTGHTPSQQDLKALGPMIVTQLAATGHVPSLVGFLVAMIGVFAWGHEYRHGMIRSSLTALPSRTDLWIAKYLVCGLWSALVAFVTMILAGLIGTIGLSRFTTILNGSTWAEIGRTELYVVLLTWLAMAFTALTRNQAFALVATFLWPLLIENILTAVFNLVPGLRDHSELARFLPFGAGARMMNVLEDSTSTFGDPLSHLGGGLVFGALTVVLMAASLVLFRRRDA